MSSKEDTNSTRNLDLFLFTFNCEKSGIDSSTFVSKASKILPKTLAGLYVFGVEEACSIIDGSSSTTSNQHFLTLNQILLNTLREAYGTSDVRFRTVGMSHVGAIGLIIITPFTLQIKKVRSATSSCGYFFSSLKGAVGLRITFEPIVGSKRTVDLTFANAHLSAYEGEFYRRRRNKQVLQLMRSLNFDDGYSFLKPGSHAFFMGDLNYRTVKDVKSDAKVIEDLLPLQDQTITTNNSVEDLVLKYDELSSSIRNDEVFMGFTEACINFPPTYKYNLGTAIYNRKRAPSWCDRILYQSTYKSKTNIINLSDGPQIKEYNSLKNLFSSDHQPVYLSISIPYDPPESIISDSGYLKILPNDQVIDHFHRRDSSTAFADTASGPTQIYVKSTRLERIINYYVTPLSDLIIGNTLWLTTTPNGRLLLLVTLVVLGSILYYF